MMQEDEKEIRQLKNRLRDLAGRSRMQGIYTFTGFLGPAEQEIFWQQEKELCSAGYLLNGGYEGADRVVIRFGSEEELGYEVPFPIACIRISPLQRKFADELSHRDFLGALMNLGIDRATLGDIRTGDDETYLFCLESIAEFLCENLTRVRHTDVRCVVTEEIGDMPRDVPETVCIQVQSLRIDAVLSRVYHISREKSMDLFREGRVYVNGRLCENNSRQLKAGETVNARGFGKFSLTGEPGKTKKGRLVVEAAVYR